MTLINLKTGKELDMGTHFDFMDPLSAPLSAEVTPLQHKNRMLLREIMMEHGFEPWRTEWWHFIAYDWKKYAPIREARRITE